MGFAKKLVVTAAVAGCAIAAFNGTRALTHVRHEVRVARNWADNQVPMEKKFDLLRDEANGLDREVDRVKTQLAREIVETRELKATTEKLAVKVAGDRKDLLARGKSIQDGDKQVSTGNTDAARARLERDVTAHQHDLNRLQSLEATLGNRTESRNNLQQTLDQMVGQKDAILAQLSAVEAEYKRLQLEQVKSKFQTDDSKLARIKERLRELDKEVQVRKERLNLEPVGRDVPVVVGTTRSVEDILKPLNDAPTGEVK